jgi:hypothetical protein
LVKKESQLPMAKLKVFAEKTTNNL